MQNSKKFTRSLFRGTNFALEFDQTTIQAPINANQWVYGIISFHNEFVSIRNTGEFLRVSEVDYWIEQLEKLMHAPYGEDTWSLRFEESDIQVTMVPADEEGDATLMVLRLRPFLDRVGYLPEGYEFSFFDEEISALLQFLKDCRRSKVKKERKHQQLSQHATEETPCKYCYVLFPNSHKTYVYQCPTNLDIEVGSRVIVPVGEMNREVEATVEEIYYGREAPIEFPLFETKFVTNVISETELHERYGQWKISEKDIVFNTKANEHSEKTMFGKSIHNLQPIHILKTSIGEFWLEADGELVEMNYEFTQLNVWDDMFVNGSYRLIPAQASRLNSKVLRLRSTLPIEKMRYIHPYEGGDVVGAEWQWNQLAVGIWANITNHETQQVSLELEWPFFEQNSEKASFGIAWTTYVSDEDQTIWMNM